MVMRWSAGSWLEDQDMWRMSGIFRSVWLLNKPHQRLSDVQLTPTLDALCRDGALQVQATVEATEAALAGLSVGVSLWRGEQPVVAHRQPLGTPTVDERGRYAERVDFSLAVAAPAALERGNPGLATGQWSPCGAARHCWRQRRGISVFAASRSPTACCALTANRC